ncbi:3-phosphoshikimate 1-carboxyvinyltransferase [Syntrophotalea carbinolica DSM 2380]|uniref:3-phosphoshikimate 1-carboxyvinyltransferase n=1 Tax=Syntrophotalea carbinolica (strain DSM 2380 / NBRC 103641 / GraBd1) TaxID=338963 RepID=AROA_SYNC1|nr:3-phosphoshikimate 1-carboxyvinyltransferase [Syntrophotalea carbinolica]Q3A3D1.1 RecName: Full=3-phosphoshikimate 1-carboxyvinyltransferase; AltName: Full=5-enolpyruvylshikimate-3-phosphate synthase; Short=EPSP synthase; Short=EPSPS [Syntrophotalea carbinolica DSM 2380]ABA89126.1 3-phosphoshikimate 1-carboxyvinyltransferase [Syntrophotalea carbinolica DSM 2380]
MSENQVIKPGGRLVGEVQVPGDKSISHRAIMLGALGEGETVVRGLLRGEDNLATLEAFRSMGVAFCEDGDGALRIAGRGLHGLQEPQDVIDCGNSGTTMRLMTGLLAGQQFFSVMTGDRFLRKRPMKRVVGPLTAMGAHILGRAGGEYAPLALQGKTLQGITHHSAVASAQVKSALLLGGLYAEGPTTVHEPHRSRDHSERMLTWFGADVRPFEGGVTLHPGSCLKGGEVIVPGDISSAAFFMVAALIVPGSELLIRQVGVNPTRSGVIDILRQMGGNIELLNERDCSGEPVADILVKASDLKGVEIGGAVIPRAIDEFPVISVAAAFAEGRTVIRDARELRVKETDRIASMCSQMGALGALVEPREDGMVITGGPSLGAAKVSSLGDHRIGMSMAVAALRASAPVTVTDTECTATSFPGFWELFNSVREH